MTTSKSPKAVAFVAYTTAERSFKPYCHRFAPKKFTQHQIIACLVLKEFFTTDYRGITAILADSRDLREILKLNEVPHYTTLQKASQRLTNKDSLRKLLREILRIAVASKIIHTPVHLAALDGTGFESHHISSYFVKRKAKGDPRYQMTTYTRYPKVGIVADCASHLILSGVPSRGPFPDIVHFEQAVSEAQQNVHLRTLVADAGYDSEKAHLFARTLYAIRTLIPRRIGRPTTKLPSGKWRRVMATRFNKTLYGQRWQVETVHSMLKRHLVSFLRARTYWSQCREMMLRLFVHNVTIVLPA